MVLNRPGPLAEQRPGSAAELEAEAQGSGRGSAARLGPESAPAPGLLPMPVHRSGGLARTACTRFGGVDNASRDFLGLAHQRLLTL